jgi:hypothetical protein
MDLEVWVRMGPVEYRLRWGPVHVGILVDVSARFGRVEVGLTFLQMLDLPGGVLGPSEATM